MVPPSPRSCSDQRGMQFTDLVVRACYVQIAAIADLPIGWRGSTSFILDRATRVPFVPAPHRVDRAIDALRRFGLDSFPSTWPAGQSKGGVVLCVTDPTHLLPKEPICQANEI